MPVERLRNLVINGFLAAVIGISWPLSLAGQVWAQETNPAINQTLEQDYDDEDPADSGVSDEYLEHFNNMQVLADVKALELLDDYDDSIEISPQDANVLRDGRVDVRVTDYLLYLVTPPELGGAGLDNIKVQRLLKNYDTDGTGRFDRETLAAIEEDQSYVSAHHDGQAVDISEVGAITCKLIKKSYLGGSSTSFQRAKPIKVAWQSRDGIARHPTPRGPSFYEVAGTMSAQSILVMLNESGEMDDFADYVKGLSVEDIFRYIGANILMKHYGAGDVMVDPLSHEVPDMLGALLLQRLMPGLPTGLPIAEGDQDIRTAIGRAHLEELLNLPPGSIRGTGWNSILKSTGQRTLENGLGLPTLTLEKKPIGEVIKNPQIQAALKQFQLPDKALNLLPGTVALIQAGNDTGYIWAGVNLLADALRLSDAQRQKLITSVKNSQTPRIDIATTGTDKAVPVDVMDALLQRAAADQKLKQLGQRYLDQILRDVVPSELLGFGRQIVDQLANSTSSVIYGDLRRSIGVNKIASDASSEPGRAQTALTNPAPRPNQYHGQVALAMNDQFELPGNATVTADDIRSMFDDNSAPVVAKVGGAQADKAIGWNPGTGYAIVNKDKGLGRGLEEAFGNAIGEIVGLAPGNAIELDGNLQRNYGNALVEQRLGIDISPNGSSLEISPQTLYPAFGIRDSRPLKELRADSGFWRGARVGDALEFSDVRLGVPLGTSEDYLRGSLSNEQLSKLVAKSNFATLSKERINNLLDLEDDFGLSGDEISTVINTIVNWDSVALSERQRVIALGQKLIGRSLDQRAAFDKNVFLNIAQGKTDAAVIDLLVKQGVRQLAGAFGVNVASFEPEDFRIMARLLIDTYNGGLAGSQGAYGYTAENLLVKWTTDATGIPVEADVRDFVVNGDIRTGLESWSAAQMVEFAALYLPAGQQLSYQEMRNAINFTDSTLINARAEAIAAKEGGTASAYLEQARRELMQEYRDESKYKISDAFLRQAEIPIPINFSKVMFSGSTAQRAEMMTSVVFSYLDQELRRINPAYAPGTLERVFNGEIDPSATDQLITNIVSNRSISLGNFTTGFVSDFYAFVSADNKTAFFTNSRYDSMWQFMENWLGNNVGISGLPAGYVKTIYYSSQNNWSLDASLAQNGRVVVPSVNQLGTALVASRLTQMADNVMNLPAGSSYQVYRAASSVASASRALAAARAANDAGKIAQAQNSLGNAQAELTAIAITVALNSCAACQQFFSSIDRLLAAPPGFTNTLVAGAIAMAFGLGPAGLIAAAAVFLFGVYKVEYRCPLPPPDRYAYPQFDSAADRLEGFVSDYYADPTKPVKDHPAPGENPFDWDDGLPFRDGNNPELWMAWSRYFTGRLLDATVAYGENQPGVGKPLQIITYRQANAEFFAKRSGEAFGPSEAGNDRLGLGFTQNSTKTTDWVHASFGGYF